MADVTESTFDLVSHVRRHLIETLRLIDEMEQSIGPLVDPVEAGTGDE